MKQVLSHIAEGILVAVLVIIRPAHCWAESNQSEALPWDQPLGTIAALLSGPIAHGLLAFAVIVAFLTYGVVGDCQAGRRLFRAGFGMAAAIETVKLLNYLLPY